MTEPEQHVGKAKVPHGVEHCRERWCGQWPPPPHPLSDPPKPGSLADLERRGLLAPPAAPTNRSGRRVDPELPTSRFLTTYRQVEQELWNQAGRPVYGEPELEQLAQSITMDRCIEAAVREHLETRQISTPRLGHLPDEGVPWLG